MSNRKKREKTSYWQREGYRSDCAQLGIKPKRQPTWIHMRWMALSAVYAHDWLNAKDWTWRTVKFGKLEEAFGEQLGEVSGWSRAMPLNEIVGHIDSTLTREQ